MISLLRLVNSFRLIEEQKKDRYVDRDSNYPEYSKLQVLSVDENTIDFVSYNKSENKFEFVMNNDQISNNEFFTDDLFKIATRDTNVASSHIEIDPYSYYRLHTQGVIIRVKIGKKIHRCLLTVITTKYDYESVDDVHSVNIITK